MTEQNLNHWRVASLLRLWTRAVALGAAHALAQVALTVGATAQRAQRVKLHRAQRTALMLAQQARHEYTAELRWNEQNGYGWVNELHRAQRDAAAPLLAPDPARHEDSHKWHRAHRASMSNVRSHRNHGIGGNAVTEGIEYADGSVRSVAVRMSASGEWLGARENQERVQAQERDALTAGIARHEERTRTAHALRARWTEQPLTYVAVRAQEPRTRHARLTAAQRNLVRIVRDSVARERMSGNTEERMHLVTLTPEQLEREYNAAREAHTPRADRHGLIDGTESRHSERGRGSVKSMPSAARVSMRDSANRCALIVRTLRTVGVATHPEASASDYALLLGATMRREITPTVRVRMAGPHGYTSHALCSRVSEHSAYEATHEERTARATERRVSASREQARRVADATLAARVIGLANPVAASE